MEAINCVRQYGSVDTTIYEHWGNNFSNHKCGKSSSYKLHCVFLNLLEELIVCTRKRWDMKRNKSRMINIKNVVSMRVIGLTSPFNGQTVFPKIWLRKKQLS